MHIFIGCFVYVVDFMILEDLGSIIDSGLSEVVLGQPFTRTSKLTYDESLGLISFGMIGIHASDGGLILYQAYGNLYAMTGKTEAFWLEDKQIPSVRASLCRSTSDAVLISLTPSLVYPDAVTRICDAVSSHEGEFLEKRGEECSFDSKKDEVVPKVDDVSLVDGVFDGAFGGDKDKDFAIGYGV
ncbi:hypothetical protein Tco_1376087 [Tanacetum coccineum]